MSRLRVKHGSWLVTLPVAGVAAAYLIFVFLPGQRAIAKLETEVSQKQDYVAAASNLAVAVAHTEEDLHKTQTYNRAWRDRAAPLHQWSALYAAVHDMATSAGTSPPRVEDHPGTDYRTLRRMPVALSCRGSFLDVFRFLEGLERFRAAIWEYDLKLTKTGKDGETVKCELTLHVFADNPGNSD